MGDYIECGKLRPGTLRRGQGYGKPPHRFFDKWTRDGPYVNVLQDSRGALRCDHLDHLDRNSCQQVGPPIAPLTSNRSTEMMASGDSRSKKKLTRNDWLSAALDALVRAGPEGLHVEPLAASLGVTKGSFYWHFEDLQDLLSSVIDYWTTRMLGAVRNHDDLTDPPGDNLRQVMEDITREDRGRYESAMRTWAKSDDRAKQAVTRVDEARIEWTTGVFREMGFSPEQAEIRGRMMVLYEYGEAQFSLPASLEQRLEWVKLRHEILTCGGP